MNDEALWQTKLHARLHDPAEKALVLLRDPAGHEAGTSRVLWRMACAEELPADGAIENDNADVLHAVAFADGIKQSTYKTVQRADWWAAAADRPQWPLQQIVVQTKAGQQKTIAVAGFARVNWAKQPQLIHPLTGDVCDLEPMGGLNGSDIQDLKGRSFTHFSKLLVRNDGVTDFKKSALAFWRFGPEVVEDDDFGTLGPLWRLLPADTRVPDHSIWDHLDLTSAFAGAFAADPNGEAALLSLAIGPVQSFIEAARSTSDLWAGSHLLARLAWEAMKPVCEALGPDAILFPRLRGVPQVDLWLRDQCGLDPQWFKNCDWNKGQTDANPLFSAALPNRFVAVVPASEARALAEKVEQGVRSWMQATGETVVDRLLHEAEFDDVDAPYCHQQMREQLAGFPEVHWAAVPFSLIHARDPQKQRDLDVTQLSAAMRPFFAGDSAPGFLSSPAWQVLQKETRWDDNTTFFAPNPGVLYPAVHDLAERVLAAAKATHPFDQTRQQGWRDSLTGESEWLTTDLEQLNLPPGERKDTLWTRLTGRFGIKKGEHLGALSAVKRLWPTLFAEEVGTAVTGDDAAKLQRFVVSTHTMALTGTLATWLEKREHIPENIATRLAQTQRVALPRKLAQKAQQYGYEQMKFVARLPAWLDEARDADSDTALADANRQIEWVLGRKPGAYYALLLMDGDRMGAWLAGEKDYAIRYRDSFHKKVQEGIKPFEDKHAALRAYLDQKRALSPNRHLAISGALNDFALTLVRHVVEEEHYGRLIYAGGDDVLAMLPVADLLPAMERLRYAYSGHDPDHVSGARDGLVLHNGFALLKGRLMRLMGTRATASAGAVIAHHQAPLGAVLRELHAAEQRAKNEGGRDAFSLSVVKRSGGALYLTEKWAARQDVELGVRPMTALRELSDNFCEKGVSRRAAYNVAQWLVDLPGPSAFSNPQAFRDMVQKMLHYSFQRQKLEKKGQPVHSARLAQLVPVTSAAQAAGYLNNFLSVAEFLARETQT